MKCFEKIYDFLKILKLENESSLLFSCSSSEEIFGGKNNAIPPQLDKAKDKDNVIKNFCIKKTEDNYEIIISNEKSFTTQDSAFFWDAYKKDLSVVRMEKGCNKSSMIHGYIFYQIEKSNKQR